jgi:hypothetical protein
MNFSGTQRISELVGTYPELTNVLFGPGAFSRYATFSRGRGRNTYIVSMDVLTCSSYPPHVNQLDLFFFQSTHFGNYSQRQRSMLGELDVSA